MKENFYWHERMLSFKNQNYIKFESRCQCATSTSLLINDIMTLFMTRLGTKNKN